MGLDAQQVIGDVVLDGVSLCEKEARGVDVVLGQSALTATKNYRGDSATNRHAQTTNATSLTAHMRKCKGP